MSEIKDLIKAINEIIETCRSHMDFATVVHIIIRKNIVA